MMGDLSSCKSKRTLIQLLTVKTLEDEKLRGPNQKTAESCGTRSFIRSEVKLMTRDHMQKGEGSRRLRKQQQAKQAVDWAEVGPGRPTQPISKPSRPPLT
jgi:hypothetical protein